MGCLKVALVRLFGCLRILAKKDCLFHSKCCKCCECDTDIHEHDTQTASPTTTSKNKRQLPSTPTSHSRQVHCLKDK